MIEKMESKGIIILLSFLSIMMGCADSSNEHKPTEQNRNPSLADTLKRAEDFFNFRKPKVLVLGTFHFEYPGLDVDKTKEEDKLDILSLRRQQELRELLDYLKKFKPNKIVIEATESFNATGALRAYNRGEFKIDQSVRDERYQIAMRLASELSLDSIYAVDASGFSGDLEAKFPEFVSELAKDYDYIGVDDIEEMKRKWYTYKDKVLKNMTLLAYHLYLNSQSAHEMGYGVYLAGDFKLENYRGADNLAINWYSRNLRIFRNIQKVADSPEDRIFVLFGNGHAAILRHLFLCSPEFDFIALESLNEK